MANSTSKYNRGTALERVRDCGWNYREIPGGFELRLGGGAPAGPLRIALANLSPAAVEGATLAREGFFAVLSDCSPVIRVSVSEP